MCPESVPRTSAAYLWYVRVCVLKVSRGTYLMTADRAPCCACGLQGAPAPIRRLPPLCDARRQRRRCAGLRGFGRPAAYSPTRLCRAAPPGLRRRLPRQGTFRARVSRRPVSLRSRAMSAPSRASPPHRPAGALDAAACSGRLVCVPKHPQPSGCRRSGTLDHNRPIGDAPCSSKPSLSTPEPPRVSWRLFGLSHAALGSVACCR
jgi:hypothetical protein